MGTLSRILPAARRPGKSSAAQGARLISVIVGAESITALRRVAFHICGCRLASMRIESWGEGQMRASLYLTRGDDGGIDAALRQYFPDALILSAPGHLPH
ncbi:hypothetical protein [Massilia sp. erpn]|uniref:hypothetical protein n=1 Tax=Massilia sp. erpn TaxID=2738142 RepID=UPI002104F51D|nr:hypothetical protein [Massilia sp. erpn]UTY56149.1 hypothetical protein HPQ68_02445 [Massilia sp. erpn]